MAIVENKPSSIEESKAGKDEYTYRVYPDIFRTLDYDSRAVDIEVNLPGVAKADITLKALPEFFHVEGKRGHMIYSANYSWGVEIVPEKTTAKYENGLLKIHAVIRNPMDSAKEISI